MVTSANPVVRTYLLFYNIILTLGWAYVGYLVLEKLDKPSDLWTHTERQVKIWQTAATMEVVHAILGFTPSSVPTVAFQLFSRLMTVWGVLDVAPPAQASYGVPLLLVGWVITEVFRYGYYTLNLMGVGHLVVWFRYSLFIILYPIGAGGEVWACLDSLEYVKKHNIWSSGLPNYWNFTFSYHYMLVGIILAYVPFLLPKLYLHMFAQRRKVLGRAERIAKVRVN